MPFKLFNTLTKQIEELQPMETGKIKMYNCGPTVYDFVHIGNLRTFLMADFLRRALEFSGLEVTQVKNITDVGHLTQDDIDEGEDKMQKAARREDSTPEAIAKFYETAFHRDEAALGILPAHNFPHATAYVPQMIEMIKILLNKEFAYAQNGSVYFEVDKFPAYGQLSGNTLEDLKVGARLEVHPDKKKPYDFALWLKADESHLMKWESPWSVGYPGWHLECSVMSTDHFGPTLDIHTGGEDNIFPHHEDEIAQAEAATGQTFVRHWLHGRHLLVDGVKMSKSKGNFHTLQDLIDHGHDPLAFRYLVFGAHFNSQMNFTWQALEDAEKALGKLRNFMKQNQTGGKISGIYRQKFLASLENNLGTPSALSVVWETLKDQSLSLPDRRATLLDFDRVLGFNLTETQAAAEAEIPAAVMELVEARENARQKQDFAESDRLREQIQTQGFSVEDTAEGTKVMKIKNT